MSQQIVKLVILISSSIKKGCVVMDGYCNTIKVFSPRSVGKAREVAIGMNGY